MTRGLNTIVTGQAKAVRPRFTVLIVAIDLWLQDCSYSEGSSLTHPAHCDHWALSHLQILSNSFQTNGNAHNALCTANFVFYHIVSYHIPVAGIDTGFATVLRERVRPPQALTAIRYVQFRTPSEFFLAVLEQRPPTALLLDPGYRIL